MQFQICERRLVLSAQMLLDVVGDHFLQMHGSPDVPLSTAANLSTVPIEAHGSASHASTGWDQVQQQFGLTGRGQTVAVIDSGIAWDHVALGKGFGPGYRVVGGWDFTEENDANPYDDGPSGFHGTHVAGIIGSDSSKYSGVAPDVDLVALRVFNDSGVGQLSWVEKALQWVHNNRNTFQNPITTVNLSLGMSWNASTVPDGAILEDELRQLFNDGIVVTASAGNSFKQYNAPGLSYPAASPYVLPVASVDDNGQLSDFSQRSDRVIAAPGRNIMSTVPDYLLGRDGKVDDFSTATGTSMAAPYVAGASVLVRQAMEMSGWSNISVNSIVQHLHSTADHVFDAVTKSSYDRLDLQHAIDSIIPDDNVGDSSLTAQSMNFAGGNLNGWINSLNDTDVYKFTTIASGTWKIDADSAWVDSLNWTISDGGQAVSSGNLQPAEIKLLAGRTYELRVGAHQEIGPFQLNWSFQADTITPTPPTVTNVGAVAYWEREVAAGQNYRAQATQDGIFSVLWQNPDSQSGSLSVSSGPSSTVTDTTWENGALRVDFQAKAGQWFDIFTPGSSQDQGELAFANAISKVGSKLFLNGTSDADHFTLNLTNGVDVSIGSIHYQYATNHIKELQINAMMGGDQIQIVGSSLAESVKMTPTQSTLESSQINVRMDGIEHVAFFGGGGSDSTYLYDTDTDDNLISRPRQAEMTGAGYKYSVSDVERIFINATAGGQDIAYLYDSAGDDRLSVRPQFTSMSGAGYFNYISGFERVYAYGTAGGYDTADIYDSKNNDRFITSGESASITGPGFASYTKFFEQVNAYATAGGNDLAMLYGSSNETKWQQGADFVNFRESTWIREARGFQAVEAYVSGQALYVAKASGLAVDLSVTSEMAGGTEIISGNDGQSPDPLTASPVTSRSMMPVLGPTESAHQETWTRSSWRTEMGNSAGIFTAALSASDDARNAPELQLLDDMIELQSWLFDAIDRQDEQILTDLRLEREMLDNIFGCHDDESLL